MLIFSGDWHGDFQKVTKEIKKLDLRDCTIFQVGDFGIGFNRKEKEIRVLEAFNQTLRARNIKIYAIRGNHDDPSYFNNDVYGNITLLKDYSVITEDSINILCVGGAISCDRKPNPDIRDINGKPHKGRKEGSNYWKDEVFVLDTSKLKDLKNIDIVVTHSAPHFCQPITKGGIEKWIKHDPELDEECTKERNDHTQMYDILKENNNIKSWFYGHMHFSNTEYFDNTKFVLLDINEFYELRV